MTRDPDSGKGRHTDYTRREVTRPGPHVPVDDTIDDYHEAPMPYFGGLSRMVRRNDDTVRATLVAGEVVFEDGAFAPGFGRSRRTGTFLRAGQTHRGSPSSLDVSPPSRALSEATR